MSGFTNWLSNLVEKILSVIVPIVREEADKALDDIFPTVEAAVQKQEETKASGPVKREQAFEEITEDLKNKGIKAGVNLINLAIEQAVSRLKK